jgi:4-amino-4-deoxy-L-arabinose transferase-like glycosyltransferase
VPGSRRPYVAYLAALDQNLGFPRVVAGVIAALVLARCLLAATVDLSEDESYYWLWSRDLAFGYYDHPPMVAYWIRLGTAILGPTTLGVRLVGLVGTLIISWLVFQTARALFEDRAIAWRSVLWLNAALLLNAAAIVITPDTPLAFFWVLALFALAKLIATNQGRWWFVLAVAAAGAALSKYTAAFLVPAVLSWAALSPLGRKWLERPEPYLAGGLALLLVAPMVLWNHDHGWISFAKQAAHAVKDVPANRLGSMGEFIGGQVGLATPLIFGFCCFGGVVATRRGFFGRDTRWLLLAATSVPIFLFFLLHSFSQRIQPNWPAFLYPSMVIAGAVAGHELKARNALAAWAERIFALAAPLGLTLTVVVLAHLAFGIVPLAASADPTARMHGWSDLADRVEQVRIERNADLIATINYGLTATIAYRIGRPEDVIQLTQRVRYAFAPPIGDAQLRGRTAVIVLRAGSLAPDVLRRYFGQVSLIHQLVRASNGDVAATYDVFLASDYRGGLLQ